eukprot:gene2651-14139_t
MSLWDPTGSMLGSNPALQQELLEVPTARDNQNDDSSSGEEQDDPKLLYDNEEYVGTAGFKGRGKHAGARRKKGGDAAGDVGAGEVAAGVAGISVAGSEGGAAEDGADSDSDLDSEEEAKLL